MGFYRWNHCLQGISPLVIGPHWVGSTGPGIVLIALAVLNTCGELLFQVVLCQITGTQKGRDRGLRIAGLQEDEEPIWGMELTLSVS